MGKQFFVVVKLNLSPKIKLHRTSDVPTDCGEDGHIHSYSE